MSGEYQFNEGQIESMLQDLKGQVARFDSELETFQGSRNTLKSMWEGDEAEQYEALFSRFQAGATVVRNILAEVHNALGSAGEANSAMRTQMRSAIDV
ncbi:WXG100 family type VII secretion target [Gordonia sp. (in: high G+C Gram-positive bacteria)]|uniref:WXG100 family type VII secretion target n=1 Tax=Gordonia sp. (in: high G+C Gram-positive bacteria) TaxID=84139 RepID=UPI003C786A04